VQASGEMEPLDDAPAAGGIPLVDRLDEPIRYRIVPESDLNGASLVYFARYEAMMNYGERLFLGERLPWPISTETISYLSTEHRRAYFFANASPSDEVLLRVSATLLPPGSFPAPAVSSQFRTVAKIVFRLDLYRSSDNVLMASSLVRKALNVPGSAKGPLNEVERLLRRLR
jgi:hypothetical protein